ncbi:ATP-grasp fold amidoligase family protein [Geodermatophilus sp. DF01_2]|uniref:ATP-grasp fold amidoligase family protein n=1 Tax=Geodermatophilus sp. DF01-2 TaxID=2559610 RepID=UPI0014301569|nr:ATP-grasp fold amidoligase family protein [Geodermatophilus sp. DF01_2]
MLRVLSAARLLPSPVRRVRLYRQVAGRFPPLRPRTFTEKLNWRICVDRRALLAPTCDKLAMKEHARTLAPGLVRIPETLWCGTDVAELADVALPDHWVLKPNHSCIRRLFGDGPADVAEVRRRTAGWVEEQYWRKSEEWAYRRARPGLLVEEFVGLPGAVPADLKVLVVGGEPRLVELHTGRDDDHRARLYSPAWEPLPWTIGYRPGPDADPPELLEDLLKAATALADGFDMLRVDFYEADGELWFGELTPYPGAGLSPLEPALDAELGGAWPLPPLWRTRR